MRLDLSPDRNVQTLTDTLEERVRLNKRENMVGGEAEQHEVPSFLSDSVLTRSACGISHQGNAII